MIRVELRNISKSFGGILALRNVTLKVNRGEIHSLVGENGAGKSTLMKILSGAYTKDTGQIFIDGKEVHIKSTLDSKKLGIGIIYQEFSLIPELSVAENVFLNHLGSNKLLINLKKIRQKTREIINSIGFNIDPTVKVGTLSIAKQQIVEIAKALSEKVKVLILDEPSAVLGTHEIKKLFDTLVKLKNDGVSVIYISHHLNEIFQISDRVTVLKDGISSESISICDTNKDEIIQRMLGRTLDAMFPSRQSNIGQKVLEINDLYTGNKVKSVSFYVKAGEVLGIAGLVGSGRTEILRALFGADKKEKGNISLFGKPLFLKSSFDAVRNGIGMVPEDRKTQGILLSLPIKHNISITNPYAITDRFGFIKKDKENIITDELINKLRIKSSSRNQQVGNLSGGNQQKIALAKWINKDSKVMLIDEPTRGMDLGAKVEIYYVINELSQKGVAVILVSSETAELMGVCDRILVMREGQIQGQLMKNEFSEEAILRLSIGANA